MEGFAYKRDISKAFPERLDTRSARTVFSSVCHSTLSTCTVKRNTTYTLINSTTNFCMIDCLATFFGNINCIAVFAVIRRSATFALVDSIIQGKTTSYDNHVFFREILENVFHFLIH